MKKIIKTLIVTTAAFTCSFGVIGAEVNIGLINGDFESPSLSPYTYSASDNFPDEFGWKIAWGQVDLYHDTWQPASGGRQSLDLNGWITGSVYQDFIFPSAGTWVITFSLSANPDLYNYGDGLGFGVKEMQVDFGTPGQMSLLGTYGVDSEPRRIWDMQWVTITTPEITVSDANTYRLQFSSLVPGAGGAALDNVQIQLVPEPSVLALVGSVLIGGLLKRRASANK
ncbi:MAG: PEP-CTERM sorting domain-containing protein [Verrucomicrobiae bacterium]|nr:PEP-CTERM sorting domain-containing protein [Verrucomicrobiae bacterium]